MIYYKTNEEIELLRESSLLVGKTLAEVAKLIKPGVTTLELDKVAEEFILDNDAKPGFKGYGGFPNSLCISVNEAVVHGIPKNKPLEEGDVVSVDCGVLKNGFYGDSAYTFEVGEVDPEVHHSRVEQRGPLLFFLHHKVLSWPLSLPDNRDLHEKRHSKLQWFWCQGYKNVQKPLQGLPHHTLFLFLQPLQCLHHSHRHHRPQ